MLNNDWIYFNSLGYKTADRSHAEFIIKGFQSHVGIKADGIIGPITRSRMRQYNKNNYCPEVFKPIKPYVPYTDEQVESLLDRGLVGLGSVFNHYSKLNDFNVLNNINHAVLESAAGTSKIARDKNNLYGWAAYDSSPYASAQGYRDYEDCIETWSREYNKLYLEPTGNQYRGNNEYCVNIVYATSSVAGINKAFLVQRYLERLKKK